MNRAHKVALAIFILLACLADVVWIRMNAAPPRTMDDAQYLAQSVDLYYILKDYGPKSFLKRCLLPAREHPPMMKILPVPLYVIYKPGTQAALYAYTLLIPVFCIYLFLLTRTLFPNDEIALLAVIITGSFPLTYGLWRHVLIEFGMGVATVPALYHLVKSDGFRVRRHVLWLGVFLGWGMLWKILFPLFVAAPIAYLLIRRWRSLPPGEAGALARHIALLAAGVVLIAGPFYAYSGRRVVAFALFNIQDPAIEAWGLGPVFSLRTLLRYWVDIINFGISVYFFLLLVVFGGLYIVRRRKIFPRPATEFLLAWFLLPFVVGSFSKMKELRYMFPIYPVIGILIAALVVAGLATLKRRTQFLVLSLLALYPAYQFLIFSFDLSWLPRKDIGWGPFKVSVQDLEAVSLQVRPQYTFPANPVHWPIAEVVKTLAAQAGPKADPPPQVLVPGMNLYFNWDNLTYEAKLQRARLSFHGSISNAQFLIMLTGPDGRYGPLDYRDHRLQKLLDNRRLPFVVTGRIPLPGPSEAVLYKRSTDASCCLWDRLAELAAYDATDFKGARADWTIGSDTRPVIIQEAETDVGFSYIYIPQTGAALRFGVAVDPAAPMSDCPRTYEIKAAEMSTGPAEVQTLLSKTTDPAGPPEDPRWLDEEVDLSSFRGKVIEIVLAVRGDSPAGISCNRIGWSGLEMTYYPRARNGQQDGATERRVMEGR